MCDPSPPTSLLKCTRGVSKKSGNYFRRSHTSLYGDKGYAFRFSVAPRALPQACDKTHKRERNAHIYQESASSSLNANNFGDTRRQQPIRIGLWLLNRRLKDHRPRFARLRKWPYQGSAGELEIRVFDCWVTYPPPSPFHPSILPCNEAQPTRESHVRGLS